MGQANLDGTAVTTLVSGLTTPHGLALDLLNGHIYWTDFHAGRIQRSDLDGANVTTLLNVSGPAGLAIDVAEGDLYWTSAGKIQSSNLDGSNVVDVVTGLSGLNNLTLTVLNPVPEPSSLMLACMGLFGLLAFRNRRCFQSAMALALICCIVHSANAAPVNISGSNLLDARVGGSIAGQSGPPDSSLDSNKFPNSLNTLVSSQFSLMGSSYDHTATARAEVFAADNSTGFFTFESLIALEFDQGRLLRVDYQV